MKEINHQKVEKYEIKFGYKSLDMIWGIRGLVDDITMNRDYWRTRI